MTTAATIAYRQTLQVDNLLTSTSAPRPCAPPPRRSKATPTAAMAAAAEAARWDPGELPPPGRREIERGRMLAALFAKYSAGREGSQPQPQP